MVKAIELKQGDKFVVLKSEPANFDPRVFVCRYTSHEAPHGQHVKSHALVDVELVAFDRDQLVFKVII
jgi:hypothetical protein